MKSCNNHIDRRVFSKGLCAQCYKIKYPSTLRRSPLKKKPFFIFGHPTRIKKTALKKRAYKIKSVSDKRKGQNKTYAAARKEFLITHPTCEIKGSNCTGKATEIHHTKGREGKLLLEEKWWKATCHKCHMEITNDSKKAIKDGHSHSRHIK